MSVAPDRLRFENDFRQVLRRELEARCRSHPRYSLRAFAKDLKLAPSRLSEVLSGKQGLSRASARSIGQTLGFGATELETFCDLVDSQHARAQATRELARIRVEKRRIDAEFHTLQNDAFQAVSDWYHFAILQLTALKRFKPQSGWIAARLGITPFEVDAALDRLERLELIERSRGKIIVKQWFVNTTDGTPSEAIRKFNRQVLGKALQALETRPLDERTYSSIIFPMKKSQVADARKWIRGFRRRLTKKLDPHGEGDAVYCLSIQLFNLLESG